MKLKTFNRANSLMSKTDGTPTITVSKVGMITLSKTLCENLQLSPTDKTGGVFLHQDEENPRDWFIEKSENADAFKLRSCKNSAGLCFNSGPAAKALLKSIGQDCTCRFRVAALPIEDESTVYAIFTDVKQ